MVAVVVDQIAQSLKIHQQKVAYGSSPASSTEIICQKQTVDIMITKGVLEPILNMNLNALLRALRFLMMGMSKYAVLKMDVIHSTYSMKS